VKGYFHNAIGITTISLMIIIIYPLLTVIASGYLFVPYQTIKNQINNRVNKATVSGSPLDFRAAAEDNTISNNNNNSIHGDNTSNGIGYNVAILNFYDDVKSQFTNAKPILDKYGFKGTFFIVCNWAGAVKSQTPRMTWQEINQLYREGHDIESHTMRHKRLDQLSAVDLDYQVGQSKQCIHDHIGVMPTVFSPPHSIGWNNATVINTIAKYYDLSIGGFVNDVMFLHCYGWKHPQQDHSTQRDCRPYSDNGTLNYASRYDIKENAGAQGHSNDTLIFDRFANLVNRERILNSNNNNNNNNNNIMSLNSVLILGYHDIDNNNNNQTISKDSTSVALFDKEMKYLHDNNVRVITMSDLGYDQNNKYLYVNESNH
jgi:peptidoglycan/xylan/chitin deacetylase (PgdA/CDA1 family)